MDFLKFQNNVQSFINDKNKTEIQRQNLIEYGVKLKASKDTKVWKGGCQAIIESLCKIAIGSQGEDHARAGGRAIQHFVEQGYQVEDQVKLMNKSKTKGKIPDVILAIYHEGRYKTHEIIVEVETRDSLKTKDAEDQIEVFNSYAESSILVETAVIVVLPEGHIVEPPAKAAAKSDAVFMESGYGLANYGSPRYFLSKELPR